MKNTLALWPKVKKSQVRAAFTPQGEKKGRGCSLKAARRARLQSEGWATGSAEQKHVFSPADRPERRGRRTPVSHVSA